MPKNKVEYSSEKLNKFKKLITDSLNQSNAELSKIQTNQKEQKRKLANTNVDFNENSKHFQQQAKEKQLIRRLQRKSRELRSALNRIEDKTYGICGRSGKLIREARLEVMPSARFDIIKQ